MFFLFIWPELWKQQIQTFRYVFSPVQSNEQVVHTLGATTEAALTTKERNWLCLRVPGFKVPNLALEALSEAKLLADTVTGDAVS